MKKKRYITLALMLSLLLVNNVYADCSEAAKKEFEKISDQYKITTTYDSITQTYTMRIEEGAPEKFSYVFAMEYDYRNYKKISDTVAEITGLKPGMSFDVTIMGKTQDCQDSVRVDDVKLERNNKFYGDPLCEGIEEFVLCQEMYDKEIDRETFEERIELYKEKQETKKEEEKQQIEKEKEKLIENTINKIINYIKENLVQVIIIVVFIILVTITTIITVISAKKSRRLE